jgi:hypothetical protein
MPLTVYVANVGGLRQSQSLIICDDFLKRDWLRKYELHCGSRSNEHVASGDST